MTVLTARYDTPQPSKGTYSAIVYIDGSQVVAEDADGRVIASGVAGLDDATVIQTVINSLLSGSTIKLSNNIFYISTTINLEAGIELSARTNATLVPLTDIDVVHINPGSRICNICIDTSTIAVYASSCISFVDAVGYTFNNPTVVDGVQLIHERPGTIAGFHGYGINITTVTNAIYGLNIQNTNICGCWENGIRIASASGVNANNFSNIWGIDSQHFIYMTSGVNTNGNIFNGLQYEACQYNLECLHISGYYNSFDIFIWDWNSIGGSSPAVYFDRASIGNAVRFKGGASATGRLISDYGTRNQYHDIILSSDRIDELKATVLPFSDYESIVGRESIGRYWSVGATLPAKLYGWNSIVRVGNGIMYAANGDVIYASDNAANSFYSIVPGSGESAIWCIKALNSGIVLAGTGQNAKILRSTNYGRTWTVIASLADTARIYTICWLGSSGIVLAGSDKGVVYRSTDFGLTWDAGTTPAAGESAIYALKYLGKGVVVGGTGAHGHIIRSTDYGSAWTDLGQQFSQTQIYCFEYCGSNIVLAGTSSSGNVLVSNDKGINWDPVYLTGETICYSLEYMGGGVVIAGTAPNGKIFKSTNYGKSWIDLGTIAVGETTVKYILNLGSGLCIAIGTATEKVYRSSIYSDIGSFKNSGSSTGTGAEQTIAHGLVAAPNKVVITPTVAGTTVAGWWADDANIYVTVTNGKTYNWSAEI